MAKLFKALLKPKKAHAENGAEEIIIASDEFDTAKAFADNLIELLKDEGEDLANWFAPKVEKIEEAEFFALNASDDDVVDAEFEPASDADFSESDEMEVDEVNHDTGEIKQEFDRTEIFRYFEFERGFHVIIKTEFTGEKWLCGFFYPKTKTNFISEREFSSDENAAVNAIGFFIDHLNKQKNIVESNGGTVGEWYKKTVVGLSSNPEQRLITSIIDSKDAGVIISQIDIAEEIQKENPLKEAGKKFAQAFKYARIFDAVALVCARDESDPKVTPKAAYISIERELWDLTDCEERTIARNIEKGTVKSSHLISNPKSVINGDILPESKTQEAVDPSPIVEQKTLEKLKKIGSLFNKKTTPEKPEETKLEVEPEIEQEEAARESLSQTNDNDWLSQIDELPVVENDEDEENEFDRKVNDINARLSRLELGERLVIDDLENEVYHACDGVSSTKLKVAIESLMKYDAKFISKTISQPESRPDHFILGSMFHTLTLEPHLFDGEYYVKSNEQKSPTSAQREKYDAWVSAGKPSKKDEPKLQPTDLMIELCEAEDAQKSEVNGRVIVSAEMYNKALAMAEAVRSDPDSSRLVKAAGLKCERSHFLRDEETGLLIKCRPDAELGSLVADLKSISLRGNPDEDYLIYALKREVLSRGYHVSAAMYLDITKKTQFVWIWCNTEDGYHWSAPTLAGDVLIDGHDKYRKYLKLIALGIDTGIWEKPKSVQLKRIDGKIQLPTID
jgi:hypothetical protein